MIIPSIRSSSASSLLRHTDWPYDYIYYSYFDTHRHAVCDDDSVIIIPKMIVFKYMESFSMYIQSSLCNAVPTIIFCMLVFLFHM